MTATLPPVDRSALVAVRRDLHQHPELGFEETRFLEKVPGCGAELLSRVALRYLA